MHVSDPSALIGSSLVFLLGLLVYAAGQRARREERCRQEGIDQKQAKADEENAERQDETAAAARAEQWRVDAETWRRRAIESQSKLDALQALHDHLLSEWIEIGTTRDEQLELARFAYRQRMVHDEKALDAKAQDEKERESI